MSLSPSGRSSNGIAKRYSMTSLMVTMLSLFLSKSSNAFSHGVRVSVYDLRETSSTAKPAHSAPVFSACRSSMFSSARFLNARRLRKVRRLRWESISSFTLARPLVARVCALLERQTAAESEALAVGVHLVFHLGAAIGGTRLR